MSDRQDEIVSLLRSISHKLVDELGPAPIVPYVPPGPEPDPRLSPLRFTNIGNDVATIAYSDYFSLVPDFKIRRSELEEWQNWDYSAITLNPNEYVEMCGDNTYTIGFDPEEGQAGFFVMTGTISASGNLLSICYENLDEQNILSIPEESNHIFQQLFAGCESLKTAPLLTAINLQPSCYNHLFTGSGIETAPELPAVTLANDCYGGIFQLCSNLVRVKVDFTTWSADTTTYWMKGVPASGTFICPAALDTTTRDDSHVPSGWTVQDA